MKQTFWSNQKAEAEQGGLGAILAIIGAVVVAVVYFALVPMLGSKIDDAADVPTGSQWNKSTNDDIATGYELWGDVGGMIGIAFIIAIVAVILYMLRTGF